MGFEKKVIQQLFENYDKLSEDIIADISLKKLLMLNVD